MPPKQKFSKEAVLEAAFQLVREEGIENLNARNIAKRLKSSIQPVFGYYKNMADLKADLYVMADDLHSRCFAEVKADKDMFRNIGLAYIDFALEEPNLFRILFMAPGYTGQKLTEVLDIDDECCPQHIREAIAAEFDVDSKESMLAFTDIWLYAHGIASMLVAGKLPTPRSEIESMLDNMNSMLLQHAKRKG